MTEPEWETCLNAGAMLEFVRRKTGERKLRLVACACARFRWSGLVEDEFRRAVETAEQCADGLVERSALRTADDDIWPLYWGIVRGEADANAAAAATVDDFAGNAAERAVGCLAVESADLLREILGNPFRAVIAPEGADRPSVKDFAQRIYATHSFDELPRLSELLIQSGCCDEALLTHLCAPGPHFRGCWALDAVLGNGQGRELLTESEWLNESHPSEMLRLWDYYQGTPSARKQRLLACACCSLISHLMTDEYLRQAIDTAVAYADGSASRQELARLHEQALALGLSRGEVLGQMRNDVPGWAMLRDAWRVAHAVACAAGPDDGFFGNAVVYAAVDGGGRNSEDPRQAELIRELLGNPLRPPVFDSVWRTTNVLTLALSIYEKNDFDRMPTLADALQDAGCEDNSILDHCRFDGPHIRGCWVVDLILSKS